jgi:hypothetical protein
VIECEGICVPINIQRVDGGLVVVTVVATIALLAIVLSVWSRLAVPTDLTDIDPGESQWSTVDGIATIKNGEAGGLRSGGKIIAIEGRSVASWIDGLTRPHSERLDLHPGTIAIYRVERVGRLLDIPVTLRGYSFVARTADDWSPVLFVMLCLGLAILS